ncbi:MAG: hypothetical protein A2406_04550 [Candidatus Komeilibacteria bacterium RIFOXYC1_FULL_37_11]|uniref:Uncharacterized protein n=1 Tax=Candidatus Komeilibacteria bacterium RIFOXYC1_FULL_37_11 TaxID=1798555 RepID=A0A1G2C091_9BACT|nr:MAG: hypothetical protein A2406_04550 [Candidatus Komeilibacteria bacterium RIFOXYC1_FULL_37_11]OGY95384.1 MAG: hypothetical protein A2611_01650 [Candidatus Komeilibacteria bacterium RIFOXYD1_FULL_37_29]
MIIELYGLSGSGKSTLARRLVEIDSAKFVLADFSNKLERYFYLLLYLINNPVTFTNWLLFLWQNRKLFSYKLHLLFLSMAKLQKAVLIKDKKVLLDEGLLQRVLTIADSEIDNRLLDKLLKHLNKLGHLIIMEGGDWQRFVKYSNKENSPRVKMGQEYLESWQNLQSKNNDIIKKYLAQKQSLKKYIYNKENITAEKVTLDLID